LNVVFQQTKCDPAQLFTELSVAHKALRNRIYDCHGYQLHIGQVDFGQRFNIELKRMQMEKKISPIEVVGLQGRCVDFLIELLRQLDLRLPEKEAMLLQLSCFNPALVLSQTAKVPFCKLPYSHLLADPDIENQYRKINLMPWSEVLEKEIPESAEAFWLAVKRYEGAEGNFTFAKLANYALTCLSVPVSNAVVERCFSTMSAVKTKVRNRMQLPMLDAIMRVRMCLLQDQDCCKTFQPSPKMLSLFNAENMYAIPSSENEKTTNEPSIADLLE